MLDKRRGGLYDSPMIKQIHIYDIDGTLIDSSHRYRTMFNGEKITIDFQHWLDNEQFYYRDELLPLAEQYQDQLKDPEMYTILCTARNGRHWRESESWLFANLGKPNKAFHRPDGNMEPGTVLKTRQLKMFLNLKQFQNIPRFFYEDNLSYLNNVSPAINANPVYIPSLQGH